MSALTICGECGRIYDHRVFPAPSARCPFEKEHDYDE